MTKKIAIINDLSGFGRCSLTAAISVTAAMGVQPCPLPTAVLSAQTGYPSYYLDDYTGKMEYIRQEWEKMHVKFDGIYTGFVASEEQIQQIFRFIETFHREDNFLLVDPVMGGDGIKYAMFTDSLCLKMRELTKKADIITPNLTELCLLAREDYGKIQQLKDHEKLLSAIESIGKSLCLEGPGKILVTGIHYTDGEGTEQMGNLYITPSDTSLCSFPLIGGSYSGTGDLFASCLAAGIARGDSVKDIMHMAGKFIELSIADTVRENIPRNDGVNYEKYLSLLFPSDASRQD